MQRKYHVRSCQVVSLGRVQISVSVIISNGWPGSLKHFASFYGLTSVMVSSVAIPTAACIS